MKKLFQLVAEFWKQNPVYVPLFAAFPVLSIFSANLALLPLRELWWPLIVTVLASLLVWAICALIWRNVSKGATTASVILLMVFCYRPLTDWRHQTGYSLIDPWQIWLVATIVVSFGLGWKLRIDRFLNVLATFLVLFSTGAILTKYAIMFSHRPKIEVEAAGKYSGGRAPDIVYVILDGYARGDNLQRTMGLDDSSFLQGLKDRGFFIASNSHSNYVQTELSLSSSLNMDWVQTLVSKPAQEFGDRSVLDELVNNSRVSRFLKARGYEYIVVSSGFPSFHFGKADLHIEEADSSKLLETALLDMTPLADDDPMLGSMYQARRRIITEAVRNLQRLAIPEPEPRFIFAHILAPHPPFVFRKDMSMPRQHGSYGFWDGSDYLDQGHTKAEYRDGYTGQLQAINQMIMPSIDAWLNSNGPKPIIIIQGDHGSKLNLAQNSLAKTDVDEAFQNLAAVYAPEPLRSKLYPNLYANLTPVNEFRIIFSSLFDANLPNYPDRSWYSEFERPFHFTEVTRELKPPSTVPYGRSARN